MKKRRFMSEETKRKIGEANKKLMKGKHNSILTEFKKGDKRGVENLKEWRKTHNVWNKGIKIDRTKYPKIGHLKKHSNEAIEKMRLAHKGFIPPNKGIKGWTNLGSFKKGHKQFNTGRTWLKKGHETSKEARKKMSIAQKNKIFTKEYRRKLKLGIKKYWDKRGRKLDKRPKHYGVKYNEWRLKVYKRDDFTCKVCEKVGGKLQAHHIKPWNKYPELRFDINNGITLCIECHKKTDNYGGKGRIKRQAQITCQAG
jgi:hypothetical protein